MAIQGWFVLIVVSLFASAITPGDAKAQPAVSIELVSIGDDNQQVGDRDNFRGRLWVSTDGDRVLFSSEEPLVADDLNGVRDGFMRIRSSQNTERVTRRGNGRDITPPAFGGVTGMSANGRFVAFAVAELPVVDWRRTVKLYVRDLEMGKSKLVLTTVTGDFSSTTISDDGNIIAFVSSSTDLGPAVTNGNGDDVYVHDRSAGETIRLNPPGAPGFWFTDSPEITPDGRYVVYEAYRDIYRYDLWTGDYDLVSVPTLFPFFTSSQREYGRPSMSANGRFVAYQWEDSGQIFLRDMTRDQPILVSAGPDGDFTGGGGADPAISADGRFIVFVSTATGLGPDVTGSIGANIFLYDALDGSVTLINRDARGELFRFTGLDQLRLSGDGSTVVFVSDDSDLVANDNNGTRDIFAIPTLVDNGNTPLPGDDISGPGAIARGFDRLSVGSDGQQVAPNAFTSLTIRLSFDGNRVLFGSTESLVSDDLNGTGDGYVRDRSLQSTERVTLRGDGSEVVAPPFGALIADMSSNGRFVAFSTPDGGVVESDTNATWDLFVRDVETSETERVSLTSQGVAPTDISAFGNAINDAAVSDDGNIIAFVSNAANLVRGDRNGNERDVFVRDRAKGETIRLKVPGSPAWWTSSQPDITPDGRYVVYRTWRYIYRVDLSTGAYELVSTAINRRDDGRIPSFDSINPVISADGRFVAYNVVGAVAYRDMNEERPTLVANLVLREPSISADGRFVLFVSRATNLGSDVSGGDGTYMYVLDANDGSISLASRDARRKPLAGVAGKPEISGDGLTIVFASLADSLVVGDLNRALDIFAVSLGDRCDGSIVTISGSEQIRGTDGDDVILASNGPDTINAGAGNDIICGLGGDDLIFAGSGNDVVYAGPGNDRAYGGRGRDSVLGNQGVDRLGGGPGNDNVVGGPGNDAVAGGDGFDTCVGSGGRNWFYQCEKFQR